MIAKEILLELGKILARREVSKDEALHTLLMNSEKRDPQSVLVEVIMRMTLSLQKYQLKEAKDFEAALVMNEVLRRLKQIEG